MPRQRKPFPESAHGGRTLFNYFETKEDLALDFLEEERPDHRMAPANRRLKNAECGKTFRADSAFVGRLDLTRRFIGAVYMRALQPTSKLAFQF